MQEGKRQKQVAELLRRELSDIFQRIGLNIVDGGMISITSVRITPDLLEARVYLSIFKIEDPEKMMEKIRERAWEIKKELAARVGKQLRRMPELSYFLDDTMDYVFKMEDLFKKIHDEQGPKD
ncbi:MAG TPA: 30S ribosome-binding factor RbfA [Chitinophagaceae bacterium]|jgi:ribosome-binding factor A|nr:30S ribosome-binding factor RbfA [Chitinophagaceae bacterium]